MDGDILGKGSRARVASEDLEGEVVGDLEGVEDEGVEDGGAKVSAGLCTKPERPCALKVSG